MEDVWLAKAAERLLLPALRIDSPEIVDLNLPLETIFHGCALLSLRRERTRSVAEILRGLWREGMLKSSRLLVAFDEGVDVQDVSRAWWRAVNAVDPARDVHIEGGRLGIDATRRPAGAEVGPDPTTLRLVAERWREYGID
jgi:4-hydroxy-3-polyprenylbenzoate decarboxylase